MRSLWMAVAAVVCAMSLSAVMAADPPAATDKTKAADTTKMPRMDHTFVMDAAQGGMMEVKLGQLAADHATNPKVKEFGQRMVADHSKANEKLMGIAKQKGVMVSPDLEAKHQKEYDRLAKLNGAEFDKEYMTMMVKDHQKDVKEFEHESTKGQDAEVKGFAADTLKTLHEHLQMAKDAATAVGVKVPETKEEKAAGTSGTSGSSGTTTNPPVTGTSEDKTTKK